MTNALKQQKITVQLSPEEKHKLNVKAMQLGYVSERSGRPVIAKLIREKLLSDNYEITKIDGFDDLTEALKSIGAYTFQLRNAVDIMKAQQEVNELIGQLHNKQFVTNEDLDEMNFLLVKSLKKCNEIREKQEELSREINELKAKHGIKI